MTAQDKDEEENAAKPLKIVLWEKCSLEGPERQICSTNCERRFKTKPSKL
jgi:hypothetical protein